VPELVLFGTAGLDLHRHHQHRNNATVHSDLDLYTLLGVTSTATQAEITHAYRRQLRTLHPDTRSNSPHTAAIADNRLWHVLAAYAVLRNPDRRAAYDRTMPLTTEPALPLRPVTTTTPPRPVPVKVTRHGESARSGPHRPPLWVGPVRQHH
jgi:hypothetical protein